MKSKPLRKPPGNTKEAMWHFEDKEAAVYRRAAQLFNQYKRNQHQGAAA